MRHPRPGKNTLPWDGAGLFFEQERYLPGTGPLLLKKDLRLTPNALAAQYLTGIEIRHKGRAARLVFVQMTLDW